MFTSKSSVASITKRSAAIKDVFTQTKNDCLALNEEIRGHVSKKQEEISALQAEVTHLNTLHKGHENLAAKIDSFLND